MPFLKFVFALLTIPGLALARRAPVPLIETDVNSEKPSPVRVAVNEATRPISRNTANKVTYVDRTTRTSRPVELGGEVGMLGRRQETKADFMGTQAFFGGRIFANFPLREKFSLKPSLGYFQKSEKTGSVSVTQRSIEGGLLANYAVVDNSTVIWDLGLSNRLQYATSTISVYDASDSTPGQFYFRLGPATSLSVKMSECRVIFGYEYTWAFTTPTRGYSYLSAGFAFSL